MNKILPNRPYLDNQEIKAVKRVIKSNWLIPGTEVAKLENNIKKFIDAKYAVATSSGSSALHLGLIALNVVVNDEVIIPTYTCTALINAVYYVGATPVIIDIEKDGFNIDPVQIKDKINSHTKAIIVPHTFGFPAEIDEIKKFEIPVIEDCAHAIGGYYKGKPMGSYGDLSIFSFYATKVMTTGHGGMIITNNKKYFETVSDLIHYDRRKKFKVSFNYQLTDIAASIGNAQFAKLPLLLKKRRHIASRYLDILEKSHNLEYWPKRNDNNLNHYRFIIKFKTKKIRDKFNVELNNKGIPSMVPIDSFQLLHRYLKLDKRNFTNAENFAQTTIALPIHPGLTNKEIDRISNGLSSLCLKKDKVYL